MARSPALLARGPWEAASVEASWSEREFAPDPETTAAADAALAALRARGSPTHDGIGARLASFDCSEGGLRLELEPARWALRLAADAAGSMSALCVVRNADGRWLAGRRAGWVASWPGRWALGAGGAVEPGENPADTLSRELYEEWSVRPERLSVEALVRVPSGLVLLVGLARLARDTADVARDPEHDAHAWWPPDPASWPPEADGQVRRMGHLLAGS
ncbi:MAG: NUDIX hydrolase [Thermoleophilaceae bacterium]